jgi:hypothetical protein
MRLTITPTVCQFARMSLVPDLLASPPTPGWLQVPLKYFFQVPGPGLLTGARARSGGWLSSWFSPVTRSPLPWHVGLQADWGAGRLCGGHSKLSRYQLPNSAVVVSFRFLAAFGKSCCPAFEDYSYSSASLFGEIPMRACAFNIQVFDKEFEVVRVCTFLVDTERCCSGLVAISAISFLTIARPNES